MGGGLGLGGGTGGWLGAVKENCSTAATTRINYTLSQAVSRTRLGRLLLIVVVLLVLRLRANAADWPCAFGRGLHCTALHSSCTARSFCSALPEQKRVHEATRLAACAKEEATGCSATGCW